MTVLVKLIVDYAPWLYGLCAVGFLIFLRAIFQARRERAQALFTLEREAASSRASRAVLGMFLSLLAAGGVFMIENYLALQIDWPNLEEASVNPVLFLSPTPLSSPTPTPLPTPTFTPRPTFRPLPPPTATPTPTPPPPPPPPCPDSIAQITYPPPNATISGTVEIRGSAAAPDFQFYKVEYGAGEEPTAWHSISEVHRTPVPEGVLDVWNTDVLPEGVYRLKLTIVDITGNYPPHYICEIRVIIQR
ncbi:MAG: hypothetical protein ACE5MB_00695 [Anaerolineae bacterium]